MSEFNGIQNQEKVSETTSDEQTTDTSEVCSASSNDDASVSSSVNRAVDNILRLPDLQQRQNVVKTFGKKRGNKETVQLVRSFAQRQADTAETKPAQYKASVTQLAAPAKSLTLVEPRQAAPEKKTAVSKGEANLKSLTTQVGTKTKVDKQALNKKVSQAFGEKRLKDKFKNLAVKAMVKSAAFINEGVAKQKAKDTKVQANAQKATAKTQQANQDAGATTTQAANPPVGASAGSETDFEVTEDTGGKVTTGKVGKPDMDTLDDMPGIARKEEADVNSEELIVRSADGELQRTPDGATACPEPVTKPSISAEQNPKFQAVKSNVKGVGEQEKEHEPSSEKVDETDKGAKGPSNELESQAGGAQVDEMNAQQPQPFNKESFKSQLLETVEQITPKSEDEAANFQGKAGGIFGALENLLTGEKKNAGGDIKEKTDEAPDTSKAKPKEITPMNPEDPGAKPGSVGAANGMPEKKSDAEVSLDGSVCKVESKLESAKVTDEMLANSGETQFKQTLDSKKELGDNAKEAPQKFRQAEQQELDKSKNDANNVANQGTDNMHASRTDTTDNISSGKDQAKGENEQKRQEISNKIQDIYNATKTDVTTTLDAVDKDATDAFTTGESAARSKFEGDVSSKVGAIKAKRYETKVDITKGEFNLGFVTQATDGIGLTSLPPEVEETYKACRATYISEMNAVVDRVATIVVTGLNKAKARIEQGRQDVQKYVAEQPENLREIAEEAKGKFDSQFDELDSQVDDKQSALIDSLAQKYSESVQKADKYLKDMRDKDQSLLSKAEKFVTETIETITKFKDMIMGVLAKAGAVIDTIMKDPMKFLGNLINAIGKGFNQFKDKIGQHLGDGIKEFLFGELGKAGLQIPESFDLKGILSLVLQITGLTYANVRQRAAAIVGPKAVEQLEQTADIFKTLASEGPAGLVKFIEGQVDNIKDTVINGIKDYVIQTVVTKAVAKVAMMFTPASAFIQACMTIIDVVQFVINNGAQLMAFVSSVLDSVGAIANGDIGGAANLIESTLAKSIPLAISFLANLIGLGGISGKIREIIGKVQKPVNTAIDKVINTVAGAFKKTFTNAKTEYKKGSDKAKKELDKTKGKTEKGLDKTKTSLSNKVNQVKSGLRGAANQVKKDVTNGIKDLRKNATQGIKNAKNKLVSNIKNVKSNLKDIKNKLKDKVTGGLKDIKKTLTNKITDLKNGLSNKVKQIKSTVKDGIDTLKKKKDELFDKKRGSTDERSVQQKEGDLKLAVDKATQILESSSVKDTQKALPDIKKQYNMLSLTLVTDSKASDGGVYHVSGQINPSLNGVKITKKELDNLKKGITDASGQRFYPEASLLDSGKHGLWWTEGIARAKQAGESDEQGQFGSLADIEFLTKKGSELGVGNSGEFPLPSGHSCIIHLADGSTVPATKLWLKVYDNGKIHGYPKR